jgi:hypothetical protein
MDAGMRRNYYKMLEAPYADIIAQSRPVDADNGRAFPYQQHMGSSDVLGIILALEQGGYVIRRRWLPWRMWVEKLHEVAR